MTLVAKIDGVTLPDGALLIGGSPNSNVPGGINGLLTSAWYGEAPSSGITLDDPDGTLDGIVTLEGLHTFTVDETACVGKERIWSGWLTGREIHRGPYSSGPSRVWECDIIDMNWAFNLMVFRASSAKRPAETDIARVAFGQASAPMAFTPVADNGRFNVTDNPVSFDEADYVAKYPIELFASVAGTSGKNFYAYWDHDEDEISFHYDLVGVGPTSTLSISNVIADSSSTVFYPFLDATLKRDPGWKVTGMLFHFKGAYAYGIRQATIDKLGPSEFSPTGLQRDEVYETDRVGKLSTAQALITRYLEERAIDRDTINVSITVPASQVNLIEAGDILEDVTFTHLPGYEAGADMPVIRRNVVPHPGRTDLYDLHLKLTGSAKPTAPGGGGGPFPPPPPEACDPTAITVVNSINTTVSVVPDIDIGFTPTPGNTLVIWAAHGSTRTLAIDGFTDITGNIDTPPDTSRTRGHLFYRLVESGDTDTFAVTLSGSDAAETLIIGAEFSGQMNPTAFAIHTDGDLGCTPPIGPATIGPVTPTGTTAFVIAAETVKTDVTDTYSVVWGSGFTEVVDTFGNAAPNGSLAYKAIDPVSGGVSATATWTFSGCWRGLTSTVVAFSCDPAGEGLPTCPDAGQPNARPEVVTLTGADGTTLCPFSDGTLHVFIDNVEQTAKLVSQDGATGDFTLGFDPTPTEVCTVEYLGR